jgi:hypothetical protein
LPLRKARSTIAVTAKRPFVVSLMIVHPCKCLKYKIPDYFSQLF